MEGEKDGSALLCVLPPLTELDRWKQDKLGPNSNTERICFGPTNSSLISSNLLQHTPLYNTGIKGSVGAWKDAALKFWL